MSAVEQGIRDGERYVLTFHREESILSLKTGCHQARSLAGNSREDPKNFPQEILLFWEALGGLYPRMFRRMHFPSLSGDTVIPARKDIKIATTVDETFVKEARNYIECELPGRSIWFPWLPRQKSSKKISPLSSSKN